MVIKPNVHVSLKGPGVGRLLEAIKGAEDIYGTVGVHNDAGAYPGQDVTPAQTALWNEFGTSSMPARPFLGPAIDENRDVIEAAHKQAASNILEGWTPQKAMMKFAFLLQLLVQNKIKSNTGEPLTGTYAPAAEQARGGKNTGYLGRKYLMRQPARTLIATGLMLRSVRAYLMNKAGDRISASAETNADLGAPQMSASELKSARQDARRDGAQWKAKNRAVRAAGRRTAGPKG